MRYTPDVIQEDFETNRTVRLLHAFNRVVARAYHRVEVLAPPRLPERGSAIIVSNHTAALDPLLIQSVIRRPVVWMMAKEYFDVVPGLKRMLARISAIPVSRDGKDSGALRSALRALSHGRVLGIFAEGRIEPDRELLPLQTGAALLALRTRSPVHPVYLTGSTHGQPMLRTLLSPQRMRMCFGAPISLHERFGRDAPLEDPTQDLADALASLKRQTDPHRV